MSLLRDAAAVVPEIHELAAAVLHEDAPLIDAQIGVRWARTALAEPSNPRLAEIFGEEEAAEREAQRRSDLETKLTAALDRVANTKAKTARGRAVKAALGFVA